MRTVWSDLLEAGDVFKAKGPAFHSPQLWVDSTAPAPSHTKSICKIVDLLKVWNMDHKTTMLDYRSSYGLRTDNKDNVYI